MDEKRTVVAAMQEYIMEHLSEEISLAELSNYVHYSPWYCVRLFKQYTDFTPAQYIRRLRLSQSARKLRDDPSNILELALASRYESVDGFQRAFYKEFGCNPKAYASSPSPIALFLPYKVSYEIARKKDVMETKTVFVSIMEKPQRKLILKRGVEAEDYFAYCEEVGCDVWGILTSIKTSSEEPVCLWLPSAYQKPHTSRYVQAREVAWDDTTAIPEGFDTLILPATTYLRFQGEPFEEEDFSQAITQVQHAMKRFDPNTLGYTWDESQPRMQLEPIGTRGYIEAKAVKRML